LLPDAHVADAGNAPALQHASVRLLAGPLLTIGPKRNSEVPSRGFRSVAVAATDPRLLPQA
jgi:hypothetical protein